MMKKTNDQIKKNIESLFQFLKSFQGLKTKPIYDAAKYEKVLWLHDIPKEKECFSIIRKTASEKLNKDSENFDKWIEIKKPKRNPCPQPPKEIKPWLKNDILDKYTELPQLFNYIIKEPPTKFEEAENKEEKFEEAENEEEKNDRLFLKDCPEIQQTFESYINQKWMPWSQEEKRLEPVLQIYNSLYGIYKKNEAQGEVYEMALGLGFLSSKNERGKDIKRHIVTSPLSIDFNSVTGKITIGPCEQGAELSLEMDMLRDSEKPTNCEEINSQLSDLSNDFWIKEEFYNCLKSWLNSYTPNGDFSKSFEKPEPQSFPVLHVCPAIILRKRDERDFIKFYDSVLEDIKKEKALNRPCLRSLIEGEPASPDSKEGGPADKNGSLDKKRYFPLPINEEQKKIMSKISCNNQAVVQGPPGTGKTHAIANLICHFLAEGQRILVTSQTDRALKVLKNKLPKEIKPLAVEILGKDQTSFHKLKNSFEAVNSEHQSFDKNRFAGEIKKLEKKDDDLTGRLNTIESRLRDIKNGETKSKIGFYEGTPARIAARLKENEEKYKWIKEFDFESHEECPVSNEEAQTVLRLIKKLKNYEDVVLEESVEFVKSLRLPQQFASLIQQEKISKNLVEKYKSLGNAKRADQYKNMGNDDLTQIRQSLDSLHLKVESLLNKNKEWTVPGDDKKGGKDDDKNLSNKNEKWIERALKDCLAGRYREWEFLYTETNKILNDNKDVFREAEQIQEIKIPPSIPAKDFHLVNLLKEFFKRYQPSDRIRWGFCCAGIVRRLKKIKIDGKPLSSYKDVKRFEGYVKAKRASEKLNNLWTNQGIDTKKTQNRNFQRNYHVFRNFCEPLKECLSVYALLQSVNDILSDNNIPQPQWTLDSIKKEGDTIKFVIERNKLQNLQAVFEKIISNLKPYKNQKNSIAEKIISAIKNRNPEEYTKTYDESKNFMDRKREFDRLSQIKQKLQSDSFCLKLKKEADNPQWEERLKRFEEAYAWQKADLWFNQWINEESFQQLGRERKELLKSKRENMERLVSKKAWSSCLSQMTTKELSSLRALIQSITNIGRGTGRSAPRHRRAAKQRMEECKTAVPAWIMPLYRVVESFSAGSKPFDVVIIDEASQTGPDGFLINWLANKIIVVGDKEQISPDNVGIREEDVEILKKKWLSGIQCSDYIGRDFSYYDYCEIRFTGSDVQLREHFRCMPEIIHFSNQISYTGIPLIPLRQYGSDRLPPLKRVFVPDAVSKVGSGKHPQNEKEAKKIVRQIKECIRDPKYKGKTFGIISLQGKAQVKIIEKELFSQIDKTEIEKRAIHVGNAYDFQGDERDVIFLSMAVAKDWNIRSLTRESFKRQYNVAASRAKDQMWLFHSVDINDLPNRQDYRRKLLDHFLKKPEERTVWPGEKLRELYKQIRETKNKSPDNAPEPFDSWFEARVFYEIAIKGYQVIPQYEEIGFRIDMIIVGSKRRLALECDGEYWHTEETEDKDLERQWRLERCGWTFHRIRESAFNRNKEDALQSLWDKLNEMEIYPLGDENPHKT